MFRSLTRLLAAVGAVTTVAVATAVVLVSTGTDEADAHGSTQVPASRLYSCRFEAPDNPLCEQASAANPQSVYDWMEVNIADADGRHEELIPDGHLCSAGRDKYAAFDEPGEWPLTHLTPNSGGQYDIVYANTAPHETAYYRFLLTKPGFDARTDTLAWDDLEEVYESGPLPRAEQNNFSIDLPDRDEPAILYVIWQRSDSPEAFYACSDVTIGGEGTGGTTQPPAGEEAVGDDRDLGSDTGDDHDHDHGDGTEDHGDHSAEGQDEDAEPAPPAPSAGGESGDRGADASRASSTVDGVTATETVTADWDGGYCAEIKVENTTGSLVSWEVHYESGGSIDALWNAEGDELFTGEEWNATLAGGEATSFGLCVAS